MRQLRHFKNLDKTLLRGIEAHKHLKYWVSAGTALGLYRNNDFIAEDTDIDIEVEGDWNNPVSIDHIEGMKEYRFSDCDGRPMQRAFKDENGAIFDVYYMYPGMKKENLWNKCDYGDYLLPIKFLDLKPIKTKYGEFPMPSPIEEYLEYRYGEKWMKKQQDKGIYDK